MPRRNQPQPYPRLCGQRARIRLGRHHKLGRLNICTFRGMRSAKLKSPTSNAAGGADGRTKALGRASSKALSGARDAPDKASRKVAREAASQDLPHIRFSERLSTALGDPFEVNITEARTHLAKMIRCCAEGQVFLIKNGKQADAHSAVLISVAALELAIREASQPALSGTMGEILASLPFAAMELEPLRAAPILEDGLPQVLLPR